MNKKTLYLGGGFRQHQILYMLPILDGYCEKKKILRIIFEDKILDKTKNHPIIKKIMKKYEILYVQDILSKKGFFDLFSMYTFFYLYIFFNAFFFNKKSLLSKNSNWYDLQIKHAVWDFGIKNNIKYFEKIEFFSKIKSSIYSVKSLIIANLLVKDFNTSHAIVHHLVYHERSLLAYLRKNKVEIIFQSFNVLRKLNANVDLSANYLSKNVYKKSKIYISNKEIIKYWKLYLTGKANYIDAKLSSTIKSKNKRYFENVVFLHVFRDSSFDCIDKDRIFADYFDWVVATINIIKDSKETWLLRQHPSAKRWGEDTDVIMNYIKMKYFNGKFPKNLVYKTADTSNINQFKNANRVVTYSGHPHLEASCFGKKPIIISRTTLSDYNKELYFKPKNYNEYKKIMLINSNDKRFKLKNKYIIECKRILFLVHSIVNFGNDVGTKSVFSNVNKKVINKIYKDIFKKIFTRSKYMKKLGMNIGSKLDQSINYKYIDKFLN
jgi:hypothetical protein